MGIRIDSLMHAAHAAGFAMAPEDMYAADDLVDRPVAMMPSQATALVPYSAARPASLSLFAQAKAIATRYGSPTWHMPRLST